MSVRAPAVGLCLAVALGAWAVVTHPGRSASADFAAALVVAVTGFGVGAVASRAYSWLPGVAVAACVGVALVLTLPASLSGEPLAPPLGYGNADGMLLMCAAAGLVLTAEAVDDPARTALLAGALGCTLLCFLIHAQAAAASSLLLVVWALAVSFGGGRLLRYVSVGVLALSFLVTVLVGLRAPAPGFLKSALSPERVSLWRDAVDITTRHPVTGSGPGTFATLSPTARADPDLAWAHSAPLQTSAELGLVGLGLLLVLVAWLLVSLGRLAPIGALLLLPTTIDYVLDFAWVVLPVSVLLGAAYSFSDVGTGKPLLTPPSP